MEVERLSDVEAPWRTQPASEKQKALLYKLNLSVALGLTKGEAADQISVVLGDWN